MASIRTKEIIAANGVVVDGVLLKDNDVEADEIRTDSILEKTAANGVVVDATLKVDEIRAGNGSVASDVNVNGVVCNNSEITGYSETSGVWDFGYNLNAPYILMRLGTLRILSITARVGETFAGVRPYTQTGALAAADRPSGTIRLLTSVANNNPAVWGIGMFYIYANGNLGFSSLATSEIQSNFNQSMFTQANTFFWHV